jgi:hypothetical protein
MGLFDGWPFRSKEEIERRNREFNERVMPLGETQKELALAVLGKLKPPKSRNSDKELLYGYLVAKDKYVQESKGQDGMNAMSRELDRMAFLSDEEKRVIRTLVQYDSEIINIDYYPSADKIRAAMRKMSPGPDDPDR